METGEQLKLEGMEEAAQTHGLDLVRAQLIAQVLGMGDMLVTADDVRAEFLKHYDRELDIGNGMGSVFVRKNWSCVGRVKSKRPEARSRWISQWRRKAPARKQVIHSDVGFVDGTRFCKACSQETEHCICESR
jgi:hypothetical protein